MPTLLERIQKGWNAFRNKDPTPEYGWSNYYYNSYSTFYRPDQKRYRVGTDRSIIAPILNRIAVDAASIEIRHVRLDDEKRYKEDIDSELNDILTLEANLDQTAREFRKDVYASLLDEGTIAVCPIEADVNFDTFSVNKIQSARVGRIVQWHPKDIDVELYNENTGLKETVRLPKKICLIVQNPFYEIMNAPNSLMARLRKKLALLDQIDDRTASGKIDMIIQLPYSTRHETQQTRAEERRRDLEMQLNGSRYGIGYIDATEKVIQLNRSLDNNLQGQIESLQKQLMDQIGISPEILNGSASEATNLTYITNIVEPIVSAFTDELKRKWLTNTARAQGQSIMFFRDPFRLVPVNSIADLGDRLIRNEILTPNEMRGILGFKPSEQEGADMLRNPNMPYMEDAGADPNAMVDNPEMDEEYQTDEGYPEVDYQTADTYDAEEEIQNGSNST